MRKTRLLTTIYICLFIALLCVTILPVNITFAVNSDTNFEKTNVLDDLSSSSIEGSAFDITKYPYDENKQIELITLSEYCYSPRANARDNYGLYLYIYNPRALSLATGSGSNKVQMAASYNEYNEPISYEKFDLKFCSVSTGDYSKLFYKFKIIDHKSSDGKTIVERVNSNQRKYDVSGIELISYGNESAVEYSVGGSFLYSGFAKGYGIDLTADSTLTCDVKDLETITLNINHTNYRTGVSSLGKNHQNEVNSVYFSIPNYYLNKYGNLYAINAEWFEYDTKYMLAVEDNAIYQALKQYRGTSANSAIPYYIDGITNGFSWNVPHQSNYGQGGTHPQYDMFDWLFWTNNISAADFTISSKAIKDYVTTYSRGSETLPIKDGAISASLFETYKKDTLGREKGKINKLITLNDTFNLKSYDSNHNWFIKLLEYGIKAPETGGDKTVLPIEGITSDKLTGDYCNNLLINSSDKNTFTNYCNTAYESDSTPYIFRFAQSDYYANGSYKVYKDIENGFSQGNAAVGYKQTLFFDFDIIQLTFSKEGKYTYIPAVSSPIDIYNAATPPLKDQSHINDFFEELWDKIAKWFTDLWNMAKSPLKIALIVIGCVAAFAIIVTIISKIIKATKGSSSNKVTVELVTTEPTKPPKKTKVKKRGKP